MTQAGNCSIYGKSPLYDKIEIHDNAIQKSKGLRDGPFSVFPGEPGDLNIIIIIISLFTHESTYYLSRSRNSLEFIPKSQKTWIKEI